MSKIVKTTATIEELHDGWMVSRPNDLGGTTERAVHTAIEALRYLQELDQTDAALGVSTIRTVTWWPKTWVGRRVVKALAGTTIKHRRSK